MKILNIAKKFIIGKSIVAIKELVSGSVTISVGDEGIIERVTIESFPDLGLFDLTILHINFGKDEISMGSQIAEKYFNII